MNDLDRLQQAVGERVRLQANTLEFDAEVTECKTLGSGDSTALSVLFESEQKEPAPQQIFRISGETLGEMSLFLVPIGPGQRGMVYEAVLSARPAATP